MTKDHYHALCDIDSQIKKYMSAPTRQEIANSLGVSLSRAHNIVIDLVDSGHLERVANLARMIRVTRKGRNLIKRGLRRAA